MAAELIRTTHTDAAWRAQVIAFVRAQKPILLDYLFDPPDQIVPQRLYRYDVFDDYLSRHRDDFEFGFDLITSLRRITEARTFGVYVIELDRNPNYVYVGQTWYLPEERLAQHNTGFAAFHAARPFKRGARGRLRRDLFAHLPRVRSQPQAEAMEASLAMQLKKLGFRVEGGH
ncbi:MAG TPA: GIY-YIG nuclease family protein [Candidatus Saccharimonadia bacterium]|nr:GIY-YIG nuclease family protein [Candidatus Saccharimonadia bacterium]